MRELKISTVCLFLVSALAALDAGAGVPICFSGGHYVYADNTGASPVSGVFQQCVNDLTVRDMELKPGIYQIDAAIQIRLRTINSPLIIRTTQLAGSIKNCQQLGDAACAVFIASKNPDACINKPANCKGMLPQFGLLQVDASTNVILDHIVIDGNRDNRLSTIAKDDCVNKNDPTLHRFGFNSHMACKATSTSGERCEFTFNYTRNALCGTGLEFAGAWGRVQGNAAFKNGVHESLLWADGLTVVRADHCTVNDNHTYNNSDVGLIIGSCPAGTISSNWIEQKGVYAFAGLMLGNFCEGSKPGMTDTCQPGDYAGTTVKANTIQCNGGWCGFGINFGPDPWILKTDDKPNIKGGKITQNNISGARVLANFGGAGTNIAAPNPTCLSDPATTYTCFQGNTLTGPPSTDTNVATSPNCVAKANVLINLYNNKHADPCGNYADTDVTSMSVQCFKACFADQ